MALRYAPTDTAVSVLKSKWLYCFGESGLCLDTTSVRQWWCNLGTIVKYNGGNRGRSVPRSFASAPPPPCADANCIGVKVPKTTL